MESELSEMVELEEKPLDEEDSEIELDLPPEYCRYRDEGCELSETCLNCPWPRCIHDEPGGKQHWRKSQRDKEIVRLFYIEGLGVKELAVRFGISRRTAQRALKNDKVSLSA